MPMINIKSTTLFDRLPTEIIFHIFDYLSSNDIIYTFFYFTQRFNNLLLQNQRYLNYFELPTTNLNYWKTILLGIGSQIEILNISTIDLSFSLSIFSNLKSIIISSPYGFPEEELKSILENNQFNELHSLKIKNYEIFSTFLVIPCSINLEYILEKIFNNENSLKVFQYSSIIPSFFTLKHGINLQINFHLHSLTLILTNFPDIFTIISHTPNLKYLNVQSQAPHRSQIAPKIDIKLKELYLTLDPKLYELDGRYIIIGFNELTNAIKHFSSSLICLSLNLVDMNIENRDQFPFNSIKLQQFLESMTELKQFHLYATLGPYDPNPESILSTFNDEFWFNHNWSFGTHGRYLYTLPFHFDHLYFDQSFEDVKSNNPEILETNPRLWYHVKIIDLPLKSEYDLNFVQELKKKMPKLITIKFHEYSIPSSNEIKDLSDRAKIQFDNVTTVHFICESIEIGQDWLIYALPNVKNLFLSSRQFPSIDSELAPILNRRIKQLDINLYCDIDQLSERSYIYFSNVEHIHFGIGYINDSFQEYADNVLRILNNFQNLKTLTIYRAHHGSRNMTNMKIDLNKLIGCLNLKEIMKNYFVKNFRNFSLFSKKCSKHDFY